MSLLRLQPGVGTVDIPYTHNHHPLTMPKSIVMTALQAGILPPRIDRPFTVLDLGCAYADTLMISAAVHPEGTFYGVDHNPGHITSAQLVARDAGLDNLHFWETPLEALSDGSRELPQCDFIIAHDLLSYLDPKDRERLFQVVEKALKPGGILLLSYNALPMSFRISGAQHFLKQVYESAQGDYRARNLRAIECWKQAIEDKLGTFHSESTQKDFQLLSSIDTRVLAHTFTAVDDWRAFYFTELEEMIQEAKLTYACPANFVDNLVVEGMPQRTRELLNKAPSVGVRELLFDSTMMTSRRVDLFVRGHVPNSEDSIMETCEAFEVVPMRHRKDFAYELQLSSFSVNIQVGDGDRLVPEHGQKPRRMSEIFGNQNKAMMLKTLSAMLMMEQLQNAALRRQRDDRSAIAARCRSLNRAVRRLSHDTTYCLALEETEGGTVLEQLELVSFEHRGEQDLTQKLYEWAAARGVQVSERDGKPADTLEAFQRVVTPTVERFITKRAPMLEKMGLALD